MRENITATARTRKDGQLDCLAHLRRSRGFCSGARSWLLRVHSLSVFSRPKRRQHSLPIEPCTPTLAAWPLQYHRTLLTTSKHHFSLEPNATAEIRILYRRQLVAQWQQIEDKERQRLISFEVRDVHAGAASDPNGTPTRK